MKNILLTLPDGSIHKHAAAIWLSHKLFPDDAASRLQAMLLMADEERRFLDVNGKDWQPSSLVRQVMNWAGKRNGQLVVTGYTVLAFILLLEKGVVQPTLYAASQVVANAIKAYRKGNELPIKLVHFEGDWEVRGTQAPTSQKDIAKAFKRHRSVSHLAAADIAISEHLQLMHVFNRTPETMAAGILTAHAIENVMRERVPKEFWEYWSLSENHSQISEMVNPVYIEGDTRAFLESGLE